MDATTGRDYSADANYVRNAIVDMACAPAGAHLGGALSCCDVLLVLFREVMRYRADEPEWEDRDLFILSKGHAAPALYATLALTGFIPEEELGGYARPGSRLAGHPKKTIPGVEFATGSLGHGLSLGVGMAMALKSQQRDNRVFVVLGDGEIQEGSVWEAAMSAGKYDLNNLTAVLDNNHLQINGSADDWLPEGAMASRWESFGWETSTIDGHDYGQIREALTAQTDRPRIILSHTTKGKGIAFMEGNKKSHHVSLTPRLRMRALADLKKSMQGPQSDA